MRHLEAEVQRLVGYDCLVTSGVASEGPYLNFNANRRLLRIWVPRQDADSKRIAEMARSYLSSKDEPAYKEMSYEAKQE